MRHWKAVASMHAKLIDPSSMGERGNFVTAVRVIAYVVRLLLYHCTALSLRRFGFPENLFFTVLWKIRILVREERRWNW
jgi:hypothetical protein